MWFMGHSLHIVGQLNTSDMVLLLLAVARAPTRLCRACDWLRIKLTQGNPQLQFDC